MRGLRAGALPSRDPNPLGTWRSRAPGGGFCGRRLSFQVVFCQEEEEGTEEGAGTLVETGEGPLLTLVFFSSL